MFCQPRTTTALPTSCGTMLDSLLHCIYTVLSHTDPALSLRLHIHPYTPTHTLSECSFRCHCRGRRPHGQSCLFSCHSHSRRALRRRCSRSHPFHRSPSLVDCCHMCMDSRLLVLVLASFYSDNDKCPPSHPHHCRHSPLSFGVFAALVVLHAFVSVARSHSPVSFSPKRHDTTN